MTEPDDPRAQRGGRYVLMGLGSLVLLALGLGALLVPPLLAYSLMTRGHPLIAGAILAAYALGMGLVFRAIMRAKPE